MYGLCTDALPSTCVSKMHFSFLNPWMENSVIKSVYVCHSICLFLFFFSEKFNNVCLEFTAWTSISLTLGKKSYIKYSQAFRCGLVLRSCFDKDDERGLCDSFCPSKGRRNYTPLGIKSQQSFPQPSNVNNIKYS
jgi:hypothetical protein